VAKVPSNLTEGSNVLKFQKKVVPADWATRARWFPQRGWKVISGTAFAWWLYDLYQATNDEIEVKTDTGVADQGVSFMYANAVSLARSPFPSVAPVLLQQPTRVAALEEASCKPLSLSEGTRGAETIKTLAHGQWHEVKVQSDLIERVYTWNAIATFCLSPQVCKAFMSSRPRVLDNLHVLSTSDFG